MLIKKTGNKRCILPVNSNMNRTKIICLCLILAINVALPGVASAATYYADPSTGSMSNDGSYNSPWSTLQEVFDNGLIGTLVQAGDTVLLLTGYHGEIDISYKSNSDYITIQAQSGHTPTFKRIKLRDCSKWIFRGLTISPELAPGTFQPTTLFHIEGSSYIIIENNNMYIVQDSSIWDINDWNNYVSNRHGIYGRNANNITVRNNTIKNVYGGILAWGPNWLVEHNTIENFAGDGMQGNSYQVFQYNIVKNSYDIDGNHDDGFQIGPGGHYQVVLRGNIFITLPDSNNPLLGGAQGIGLWDGPYYDFIIENNIVISTHVMGGISLFDGQDSKIFNNIVFNPMLGDSGYATYIRLGSKGNGGNENITIRNNIAHSFPSNIGTIYSDHNLDVDNYNWDDLFVDYQNFDYRHKAGSPAIDAGSPNLAPVYDILGNTRDAQPDIGAYEYLSGPPDTTPPSVPQNLTAQVISESQINLSWQESTDPESGISYYKIYRDSNQIGTSAINSYSDTTNLESGTSYSYQVLAVNGAGLESNRSNVASATTLADTAPPSVLSISASSAISVEILFSEALDPASAENIDNYAIDNGISIISVSLNLEYNRVTLSTTSHIESTTYILTVVGVEDTTGNSMSETLIEYEYSNGLIGLWHLDEGSGSVAGDTSGNDNGGILINGPEWTSGRINGALRFDGIDDAVEISTSNLDASGGTVALWTYAEDFSGVRYLFGHAVGTWSDRIQLYVDNGSLCLGLGDSHAQHTDIENLALQRWYNIALTWDSGNYVVYVDGIAKATGSYTGLSTLSDLADIGNTGNTSYREEVFNGIIDEVRIYNRALTVDEVMDIFNETGGSFAFEFIGDKQVDAGSNLTFEVLTQDPNQEVFIEPDTSLPFEPNNVFVNKIFSWTPAYTDLGSYQVTFVAPHGQYEDFETITITVINSNQAPVLEAIGNKSVNENNTLSFLVNANDPDGDAITYSAQDLSNGATFSGNSFSWTLGQGQAGTYSVTFIASDGQSEDSETITITVNSVSDGPLLSDDFVDGDFAGWVIVNEGRYSGPSKWSAQTGTVVQSSNIYSSPTSASDLRKLGAYAFYEAGSGWTDYKVSMTIGSEDNDGIGVMFRYQDNDNYYRFGWNRDKNYRRLVKKQNGEFTLLAEDSVVYERNRSYRLEIVVQGATQQLYIDGALVFSVTDSGLNSGSIALYSWRNKGGYFDDIVVEGEGGSIVVEDEEQPQSNQPPVISSVTITPDVIFDNETSQLQVVVNDPDGGPAILTYSWTVQSGEGNLNSLTTANPIYTPADVSGTQTVTLTVQISDGEDTTTGTVDIIVINADAPDPDSQFLLSEDFNGGDFAGWVIVNEGRYSGPSKWSAQTGTVVQSSNIYSSPTSASDLRKLGAYAFYEAGSGWTDYKVSMTIGSEDNDGIGVMFRYQDNDNYYRFGWNRDKNYRRLVKKQNGEFTLLAEDSVVYERNRSYRLEIVVQGATQQLYIDGALVFSVTDSGLNSGSIALYSWRNKGGYFDDIVAEEL